MKKRIEKKKTDLTRNPAYLVYSKYLGLFLWKALRRSKTEKTFPLLCNAYYVCFHLESKANCCCVSMTHKAGRSSICKKTYCEFLYMF